MRRGVGGPGGGPGGGLWVAGSMLAGGLAEAVASVTSAPDDAGLRAGALSGAPRPRDCWAELWWQHAGVSPHKSSTQKINGLPGRVVVVTRRWPRRCRTAACVPVPAVPQRQICARQSRQWKAADATRRSEAEGQDRRVTRRTRPRPDVDAALTYPEVGATQGDLPEGYHHVRRRAAVGSGATEFAAAVDLLMTWEMHRRSGLTVVSASSRASVGDVVRVGLRLGPVKVLAPCRVVSVVDEPARQGFAYGTLAGHPESGEESFVLSLLDDGTVEFSLVAFSRPGVWWSRVGAPANRWMQRRITARYLTAFSQR